MKRTVSLSLAAFLAAAVVACGGGSGGLGSLPPASPSPAPSGPTASPDATPGGGSPTPSIPPATAPPGTVEPSSPPATEPPAGTTIVRAYFWLAGDEGSEGLVPVLREVPKTQAVARAAIEQLLLGPIGREASVGTISSAIPDGTELLGISIEGGVATIDLSGDFGSGGGTMSTSVRLAQVVYTLTQFPTVQRVVLWMDGDLVTVFGSEGLLIDGPLARSDYHELLPDIWVDRPAWGAALNNPGRVTGLANVFEAQFHMALLDRDGRVLFDQPVMATCGTGCWGTFDVTIGYDVPQAQYGTLRVYNLSARDGSVESQRDYPVWLTPEG
jgi:spore germination protein GerM